VENEINISLKDGVMA